MPIGSDSDSSASLRLGGIALGVLGLVIAGYIGFSYVTNPERGIDEKTFCPKQGLEAESVIVLDVTDALSAVDRATVTNRLNEAMEDVPRFGRLDIFVLKDSQDFLAPIAGACNPGSSGQVNAATGGKTFYARKFTALFSQPLKQAFEEALSATASSHSPIAEAVQAASAKTFDALPHASLKRLYIVSDLMQHTDGVSFYKGVPSYESVKRRLPHASLDNVEVDLIVLGRPGAANISDKQLVGFWTEWIADQGGRVVHVRVL